MSPWSVLATCGDAEKSKMTSVFIHEPVTGMWFLLGVGCWGGGCCRTTIAMVLCRDMYVVARRHCYGPERYLHESKIV